MQLNWMVCVNHGQEDRVDCSTAFMRVFDDTHGRVSYSTTSARYYCALDIMVITFVVTTAP
jgi:hypothetical protein